MSALRRLVIATSRGPLRSVWALVYRAATLATAAWLGRGEPAGIYLRGSGTSRDHVHGLSDLDLAVITEDDRAAARVLARWTRLQKGLEPFGTPIECHYVESRSAVESACAASMFTHGLERDGGGPGAAPMQDRPGLDGEVARWRRVWGRDLRPPDAERVHSELERPSVAWLEMQFWWRHACVVARNPTVAWLGLSCVKLVAEPLRTLFWLEDGNRRGTRVEVLEEALRRTPSQEYPIAHALDLWRRLPRSPEPDIPLVVRSLAEVSAMVARRIEEVAGARGYDVVALEGLAADRPLDAVPEGRPLPLVDWRARTLRGVPDPVFVPLEGDAADAPRVAELAAAARLPVYPALVHGELLVTLPTLDAVAGRQRGALCPASDPVTFAVAAGRDFAAFPGLPGWSARDAARRAVDEHSVRLRQSETYEPGRGEGIARLLAAARVGLWAEGLYSGEGTLTLAAAATARALVEEGGADRTTVHEGLGWYMEGRALEGAAPRRAVDALRAEIRALPAYRRAGVRARA